MATSESASEGESALVFASGAQSAYRPPNPKRETTVHGSTGDTRTERSQPDPEHGTAGLGPEDVSSALTHTTTPKTQA